MDDYISREKVLNIAIQYCLDDDGSCSKADVDHREMLDEIEALPSADVQLMKHGKWLPSDSYITTAYSTIHCQICSECGADLMEDYDYDYNFCPVCGARMDGDSKY